MKKAVLSCLMFVVVLLSNSGQVFAANLEDASNPYGYQITEREYAEYNAAIDSCDVPSLECLVRYTTRFVAMEWVNDISGRNIEKVQQIEVSEANAIPQPRGVVGGVFALTSGMYAYQPAKTSRYVADVIDSAGFVTPAYAQGLGFASLDPILDLWKLFRNVAYFFFIVIFIIIGFMIMFRAKIGSQAVITAQQAIPSVIISLIAVTFSYAIAGFMIDLMYLLMFMIVGLFQGITANADTGVVNSTDLINFNITNLIGFFFFNSAGQFNENTALSRTFLNAAGAGSFLSDVGGFLGGLTLTLVITIAALISCVKLFFELLKSYATIILSIVLAPLFLMVGAIPGKNVFGPWLKGIIGNLVAFPTVLLLIIMFIEFTEGGASTVTGSGGFMPPFLLGAGQAGIVGPILGFAIILAMPEIVKKVKDVTGASDGGFVGALAGAAWGRAREAWSKPGVPFVPSAGGLMKTGAFIAGSAAGVPIGATIGGLMSRRNGESFRTGARRGALIGAASPAAIGLGLPLLKDAYRAVRAETGQLVASETIGNLLRQNAEQQGQMKQTAQEELSSRVKSGVNTVKQRAFGSSTKPQGGSLTSGDQ